VADIELKVGTEADTADVKNTVNKIKGLLGQGGNAGGDLLAGGISRGLSGVVSGAARLLGPLGVAIGGAFTFREAISQAGQFEASVNKLNTSLKLAGSFSEQASQSFLDFSSEIQKTTTFGDDLVLELSALSRNFTQTNEDAIALTKAAIDFSVATGIDATTAVRTLGQTLDGTAGRIAEVLPSVRTLTAEQLKAGDAVTLVADRFRGAAAAQTQTFSGASAQLSNNLGDVVKQLGLLVTTSPPTVSGLNLISNAFAGLATSIERFRNSGKDSTAGFNIGIEQASENLARLEADLERVNQRLTDANFLGGSDERLAFTKELTNAIELQKIALDDLRKAQLASDRARGVEAQSAPQVIGPTAEELRRRSEGRQSFSQTLLQEQAAALESQRAYNQTFLEGEDAREANRRLILEQTALINAQSEQRIDAARRQFLETGLVNQVEFAQLQAEILLQASNKIAEINQTSISSFGQNLKSLIPTFEQLGRTATQTLVGGISRGFASVGAALVKGENAFEAFGGAVLGALGDIAIQWGQYYLLTGLAAQFVPGLQATAGAIPLGIALIALGGALQASAGGASAPASTVGSGGFVGTSPDIETPTAPGDDLDEESRSRVTVNIQGDVLDTQESGIRIVELIKEAVDLQGANVSFA
jgi:hypothetical protein